VVGAAMTGNELRLARIDLGRRWRLKRPVFASELGRALGYQAQDPGESIRDHERQRDKPVPGPVAVLVRLYLSGLTPPDGLEVIEPQSGRRAA
jgi:hypothetical protein